MLGGKIKIGIIDDNPSLSEGVRLFLEDKGIDCAFAVNTKHAFFSALENQLVDILVADVIMPDVVGTELFETLKDKHPSVPTIVYSNIRNIQLINELFRIENVFALVGKTEPLHKLHTVVEQVHTTKERILPDEFLDLNTNKLTLKLTEREIEVLRLMAEGHSSKSIGELLKLSENTVLFHKKKLFTTFNTSNIYHLIVEAKECGFLN
jgi:DNA-binding NarL/FixJ family response regulator